MHLLIVNLVFFNIKKMFVIVSLLYIYFSGGGQMLETRDGACPTKPQCH